MFVFFLSNFNSNGEFCFIILLFHFKLSEPVDVKIYLINQFHMIFLLIYVWNFEFASNSVVGLTFHLSRYLSCLATKSLQILSRFTSKLIELTIFKKVG